MTDHPRDPLNIPDVWRRDSVGVWHIERRGLHMPSRACVDAGPFLHVPSRVAAKPPLGEPVCAVCRESTAEWILVAGGWSAKLDARDSERGIARGERLAAAYRAKNPPDGIVEFWFCPTCDRPGYLARARAEEKARKPPPAPPGRYEWRRPADPPVETWLCKTCGVPHIGWVYWREHVRPAPQ